VAARAHRGRAGPTGDVDAELVGLLASMGVAGGERAGRGEGDLRAPGPGRLPVRQSTLRQVLTNTESTARQYALRQKAIALGWEAERVVTIDTDQGQSGASAADREGFQRLVAEVGMGRAGIVLGLEVSRMARNNADWHHCCRSTPCRPR
jgi:Resolvase, N terminal domain